MNHLVYDLTAIVKLHFFPTGAEWSIVVLGLPSTAEVQ